MCPTAMVTRGAWAHTCTRARTHAHAHTSAGPRTFPRMSCRFACGIQFTTRSRLPEKFSRPTRGVRFRVRVAGQNAPRPPRRRAFSGADGAFR
eukprot:2617996-Prymnesium_polylepis.1